MSMRIKTKNPKPPFKILLENSEGDKIESKAYSCGECRVVFSSKEEAEECCKIPVCSCGKDIKKNYHTMCDDCSSLDASKRKLERWEKMPEETNWNGPILDEDVFYSSVDELLDAKDDEDLPDYVECCDAKKIGYNVQPDKIMDYILEELLENVEDVDFFETKIVDSAALQDAICSFLKAQTSYLWVPNGKKVAIYQDTSK